MSRLPQPTSRSRPQSTTTSTTSIPSSSRLVPPSSRWRSPSPNTPRSPPANAPLSPTSPSGQSRLRTTSSVRTTSPRTPLTPPTPRFGANARLSPTAPSPSPRLRTKSTPNKPSPSTASATRRPPVPSLKVEDEQAKSQSAASALSIKEAIALKRAEAKKAQEKASKASAGMAATESWGNLEDAAPDTFGKTEVEETDFMGRWSVRETIERARSTGNLNISSRSLACIPSALFEVHLGVIPEPLALLPNEPPLPEAPRKKSGNESATWFEQQDLSVLKAWNNEIVEIQSEISLFGSLKVIDLHDNKLTSLPTTFGDLPSLINLDLSRNSLSSLPASLFALPSLITLNISHNQLTALPFSSFSNVTSPTHKRAPSGNLFGAPEIRRADEPLPCLTSLIASSNRLVASGIDVDSIPRNIVTFDLSENPLSYSGVDSVRGLIRSLSGLKRLEKLLMKKSDIDDRGFEQLDIASSSPSSPDPTTTTLFFPKLKDLDLEETRVNRDVLLEAFAKSNPSKTLDFDLASIAGASPPQDEGVIKVMVGKRVIREAWEIEADRRARMRSQRSAGNLRASAAEQDADVPPLPLSSSVKGNKAAPVAKAAPVKEQWEIEAEMGLLTEGGKRRARALAAATTEEHEHERDDGQRIALGHASAKNVLAKYYDDRLKTLTLPPVSPPSRAHGRGFSLAAPFNNKRQGSGEDLGVPVALVPLYLIMKQGWWEALRVLELKGRRADPCFVLPESGETGSVVFRRVEELVLDGCGLSDEVNVGVHREREAGAGTDEGGEEKRTKVPVLEIIAKIFPNLRTLDLSNNNLTAGALSKPLLSGILLSSSSESGSEDGGRAGLRCLRLRLNRIEALDGFVELVKEVLGDGAATERERWKLEELDVRDNSIGKLPGELGLMPLDAFLVEGNVFRVPNRRVWEREGSKGLLAWLRSSIAQ